MCLLCCCAHLPQFPYICGVVAEALRLYPPGANTLRETGDDAFQLGPYSLPPRSTVVVGTYVMHRDPEVWPHAAAFMPERWLPVSGPEPLCGASGCAHVWSEWSLLHCIIAGCVATATTDRLWATQYASLQLCQHE
jgi:hypothetical protein